jgi:hypothetical protein
MSLGAALSIDALTVGVPARASVTVSEPRHVYFHAQGAKGECYALSLSGASFGGAVACNADDGSVAFEGVLFPGATILEISSQGLTGAASDLVVTATEFIDETVGELVDASPTRSPSLAAGRRAVWTYTVGDGTVVDVNVTASASLPNGFCSHVDVVEATGQVSTIGTLCGTATVSRTVVLESTANVRVTAPQQGALAAGEVTLTATGTVPNVEGSAIDANPALRSTATANAAAVSPACGDVLFVGLRGSGQTASDSHGYGPQVYSALQRLRTSLLPRGLRITEIAIDYPARPVPSGLSAITQVRAFLDGINKGADALYSTLQQRRSCAEYIVVSGYSQGAMAAHRTLLDLTVNGDHETLSRVAGAVVIADGDLRPYEAMTTFGSTVRIGQGISSFGFNVGINSARPYYFSQRSPLLSVCNYKDAVCDFTVGTFNEGKAVHTRYTNTRPVYDAVDAATENLDALRRPPRNLVFSVPASSTANSVMRSISKCPMRPSMPTAWVSTASGIGLGSTVYISSGRLEVNSDGSWAGAVPWALGGAAGATYGVSALCMSEHGGVLASYPIRSTTRSS